MKSSFAGGPEAEVWGQRGQPAVALWDEISGDSLLAFLPFVPQAAAGV